MVIRTREIDLTCIMYNYAIHLRRRVRVIIVVFFFFCNFMQHTIRVYIMSCVARVCECITRDVISRVCVSIYVRFYGNENNNNNI